MTPPQPAVDEGELLVVALTRPAMVGGLTLESIGISCYFPGMAALMLRSLWPLLVIPVFLLISYLVCLKDVFLFSIALAAMHCKNCVNRRYWGCRSYAPR
jgi:type IV secretion system protein VirB3